MHFETGFIKILPKQGSVEGSQFVEASYVHPFGMAEIDYGDFLPDENKLTLELSSENILRGKTAKGAQTTSFKREYWYEGGKLHYKMWMGVDGKDMKHHLTGSLEQY